MNYILFDDARRNDLLPFTFTRPVADIRVGILTIREKWEYYLKEKTSSLTEPYLSKKFPVIEKEHNVLINGSVIPNQALVNLIHDLKPGQVLIEDDCLLAYHITAEELGKSVKADMEEVNITVPFTRIMNSWDIFALNDILMMQDFEIITQGRKSQVLSSTNRILGIENIFVEEGAVVEFATINATKGPVYIGKNSEIMEGSLIRGPFALLDHSVVKMGATIYGATTIGPWCKIGGEVSNSVFFGYANKAHDGYIGNSVVGEWCNLGAATNTSNLKNTYDSVRLWSYTDETFVNTGLQFCGLMMGDHSKSGINTMFNTGTVVGVFANIFGAGFPRNFIPSFSWGGASGFQTYNFKKAILVAREVFKRRGLELTEIDEDILNEIYLITFPYRREQ